MNTTRSREGISDHVWLCWIQGLRGPVPQIIYGNAAGPYLTFYTRELLIDGAIHAVSIEHRLLSLDILARLYPCPVQSSGKTGDSSHGVAK